MPTTHVWIYGPGSGSWVVPSGVTSVTIGCWGAGGSSNSTSDGGGGGGSYAQGTFSVSAGTIYPFYVGSGGNGGNSGENTWLNNTGTINAPGGSGTFSTTGGAGGTGGTSTGSSPILSSGGSGASGAGNCGGGGAGGPSGAGLNGSGAAGGTADNGSGGAGGSGAGVGGSNTSNAGGGGGGSGAAGGQGGGGGGSNSNGANGWILITYSSTFETYQALITNPVQTNWYQFGNHYTLINGLTTQAGLLVECWGAGGGGAGPNSGFTMGGGGGAYSAKFLQVNLYSPPGGYNIQIGQGGSGGSGSSYGNNGTATWFNSTSTVYADPGQGTGTGGNASNCVGDIKYSGGSDSNQNHYGGGCAGPDGAGGNASGFTIGGNGDNGSGGSGASGTNSTPGGNSELGGGGGGAASTGTAGPGGYPGGGGGGVTAGGQGGTGGNGQMRITLMYLPMFSTSRTTFYSKITQTSLKLKLPNSIFKSNAYSFSNQHSWKLLVSSSVARSSFFSNGLPNYKLYISLSKSTSGSFFKNNGKYSLAMPFAFGSSTSRSVTNLLLLSSLSGRFLSTSRPLYTKNSWILSVNGKLISKSNTNISGKYSLILSNATMTTISWSSTTSNFYNLTLVTLSSRVRFKSSLQSQPFVKANMKSNVFALSDGNANTTVTMPFKGKGESSSRGNPVISGTTNLQALAKSRFVSKLLTYTGVTSLASKASSSLFSIPILKVLMPMTSSKGASTSFANFKQVFLGVLFGKTRSSFSSSSTTSGKTGLSAKVSTKSRIRMLPPNTVGLVSAAFSKVIGFVTIGGKSAINSSSGFSSSFGNTGQIIGRLNISGVARTVSRMNWKGPFVAFIQGSSAFAIFSNVHSLVGKTSLKSISKSTSYMKSGFSRLLLQIQATGASSSRARWAYVFLTSLIGKTSSVSSIATSNLFAFAKSISSRTISVLGSLGFMFVPRILSQTKSISSSFSSGNIFPSLSIQATSRSKSFIKSVTAGTTSLAGFSKTMVTSVTKPVFLMLFNAKAKATSSSKLLGKSFYAFISATTRSVSSSYFPVSVFKVFLASVSKSLTNSVAYGRFHTYISASIDRSITTAYGIYQKLVELQSTASSKTIGKITGFDPSLALNAIARSSLVSAIVFRGRSALRGISISKGSVRSKLKAGKPLFGSITSNSAVNAIYNKIAVLTSRALSTSTNSTKNPSGFTHLSGVSTSTSSVNPNGTFTLAKYSRDPRYIVWLLKRKISHGRILWPKDPLEAIVLTYDFSKLLSEGEAIKNVTSMSIEVFGGTDPIPTLILTGITIVNTPTTIQQPIMGGLDGCTYKIKATVLTTNGQILSGIATLPVVNQ